MIYFVHGPDRYLARAAAREIAVGVDPDGANTTWLDGRETPLDRIIAAIGAASLFGNTRVVVVSDLLARAGRDAGASEAEADDRPARNNPALASLAGAAPDSHCLILLEPSLGGPPAALKSAAPAATIVAGEPPRGPALLAWIEEAARLAGSRIDRRAARDLAESLYPQTWNSKPNNPRYDRPPDMALLTQEIEKLALAAHPDPIESSHVATLITSGPDQRLFRYVDAALAGELRVATAELDRLVAAGEEPAMILAQTLGQIELAAVARAAGGRNPASVARDLGTVSASRMSAVTGASRRQLVGHANPVEVAVQIDRRLKTGRIRLPEDALLELMAMLSEPAARKAGRSA